MAVRTRSLLPAFLSLLAIAGCGGDSDSPSQPASTPTSSSTSSSSPVSGPASTGSSDDAADERFDGCPNAPGGSSVAVLDDTVGTYAATITALAPSGATATFDVVQWLVGEDAAEAYEAANPDDPDGPPNDYYIVNNDDRLRTAPVDPAARVLVVALSDDSSADVSTITLDALVSYVEEGTAGPFWLSFEGGVIVEICEQYVP